MTANFRNSAFGGLFRSYFQPEDCCFPLVVVRRFLKRKKENSASSTKKSPRGKIPPGHAIHDVCDPRASTNQQQQVHSRIFMIRLLFKSFLPLWSLWLEITLNGLPASRRSFPAPVRRRWWSSATTGNTFLIHFGGITHMRSRFMSFAI